jgi:hypothetical protein
MEIRLIELEILLGEVEETGKDAFVERYPGAFMVAMGFLAGEEIAPLRPKPVKPPPVPKSAAPKEKDEVEDTDPLIIEPSKPPRRYRPDSSLSRRLDFTAAFKFGQRLEHDRSQAHPLAGLSFFLQLTGHKPRLSIGRGPDCDITIPDRSVSDEHCLVEVTSKGVLVVDQESTNGTFINQERIEPRTPITLANEDILTVGRYSFQLLSAASLFEVLWEILQASG